MGREPGVAGGRPRLRIRIAAVALVALFPILLFVTIEGFLRYRARKNHGYGRLSEISRIDPDLRFPMLLPDLSVGPLHSNQFGFRGPELADPKPPGTLRFAFLGASTTFCAEVSDDAHTWPHLTIEKLKRVYPAAQIDYVNAGYPGYRLQHIRDVYESRVVPLNPDVVIFYEATNEMAAETRRQAFEQGIEVSFSENALSKASLFYFLVETNLRLRARRAGLFDPAGKVQLNLAELTQVYEQGLAELIDSTRAHGSIPVLITFSMRMRRGMSQEELAEAGSNASYYTPYMSAEGLLTSYEAFNAALRRVGAAKQVLLIDGEDEIPPTEESYSDLVHFKDDGAEAMAERVNKRLAVAAPIRQLLAPQP